MERISPDTVKAQQALEKKKTVDAITASAVQPNIVSLSIPFFINKFPPNSMTIRMSLKDRIELSNPS